MNMINYIGLIGSFGIGISLIPQTLKIYKEKNTEFLSLYFILITMISSILLLIYSCYYVIIPMIITNCSVLINAVTLFFLLKC